MSDEDGERRRRGQTWDPQRYARNARFVSELGAPVVELLAPKSGERVLDLGCGDGALTAKLVAAGCEVVAVDSSAEQVAAAKAAGLDARLMDAEALGFDGGFDAVFSNAVLHWVRHPDAAIDGVWRALEPGGRFVGELGGYGCVAEIVAALGSQLRIRGVDPARANPWYFPTDREYARRLERRGFALDYIALIPRPTPLPGDIDGWLETFAESFTSALPAAERAAFIDDVREELRPRLCGEDGSWTADYVRLRFAARRPNLAG